MKKKKRLWGIAAAALLALIVWVLWGNTALELNSYSVISDRLPAAFDGYRIAHISDLHNTAIGKDNAKLLEMLRRADPDLIAITGDLVDSRDPDRTVALDFVRRAVQIAPCCYVNGNHEARLDDYNSIKDQLTQLGVTVLENEKLLLTREEASICVLGVKDPAFSADYLFGDGAAVMDKQLKTLEKEDRFTLLLSHRPELLDVYAKHEMDLVLSGHAHGGQFRLPFVGGLYAPNQGLFPQYDAGLFQKGSTQMIVSRGIGNSLMPLRFCNRPEIILIQLHTK